MIGHHVEYASRFLNSCERKDSVNELELLAAAWAIKHFKDYLYGRRLTLKTDHQALVSALKTNRGNKTYQSRLTRWIDRLIPFDFDIHHLSGSTMGPIDDILRHPFGKPQPPAYWDEQFVVAFFDDFAKYLEFQDSSINNISLNENPLNYLGTEMLKRNEVWQLQFQFTRKLHSLFIVNCLKIFALQFRTHFRVNKQLILAK